MTTFLIISKNQTTRDSHASTMIKDLNIHDLDITILEKEGSIGIEDIRSLQKQLMLKPFKSIDKAAIIKNADNMTMEAQNALLKTLEEPPNHTYIFLTAPTSNTLLPTILSRASLITLRDEPYSIEDKEQISQQLNEILFHSINSKLKLAETLAANKGKALQWLEAAIYITHDIMIKQIENASGYISLLESLQQTYTVIKTTNVNVRLALENLFLNL